MTNEPRVKILEIEVSDDYCKDILVTCVERGSNYWAGFNNIVRDEELNILECQVYDREEGCECEMCGANGPGACDDSWKRITIEDIRRGVKSALKSSLHPRYKVWILEDNNDALTSDAILQCVLYGEVRYS